MAMVKPDQVADGIITFADAELLPVLTGPGKFMAGMILGMARRRIDVVLDLLMSNKMVAAMGLIDANGMIDVDAVIAAAKESAHKYGKLEIPLPSGDKYMLGEDDFDKIKEHIAAAKA